MTVQVGNRFRSIDGEAAIRKRKPDYTNRRTIRILETLGDDRVVSIGLTNADGTPATRPRRSTLSLATLASGYVPLD